MRLRTKRLEVELLRTQIFQSPGISRIASMHTTFEIMLQHDHPHLCDESLDDMSTADVNHVNTILTITLTRPYPITHIAMPSHDHPRTVNVKSQGATSEQNSI
jgi:hypothetical protein